MKRIWIGFIGLVAGLTSLVVRGEGTVTDTQYNTYPQKVIVSWLSSTNNRATGTTAFIRGEIARVVFQPDATAVPLADYDITLKDSYGVDVLAGLGSDLSATEAFTGVPFYSTVISGQTNFYPYVVNDRLTLAVDNCGSNKQGIVVLYLK